MALQVWLPLNGNLNNNGLSDVTVTNNGATVNDSGKIGECYSFDGNDDFISISCPDLYNTFSGGSQPFSIAFWVYHADTTRAVIFGDFGLSGTISFNIELTSDAHRVRFYWNAAPDKIFNTNSSVGINTWTHIVLVYDGNEICIYKNGVQQSDKYSGTLAAKSKTSGVFYLGRDQRTGATALNGKLNDFRIYDHALSPREVKEISKGLVLHYPLSMPGQENLLLNTATPVSWITTYTNTDQWSTKDIYNMKSPVNQLFEANDTATFSFDWEFTPGSSGSIKGSFHLETGNVTPWILGSVSKSTGTRNNASNYIDLSTTNKSGHVTCTFIVSSSAATAADTFRYFRIRWDKTPTDGTLTLSNCKLERGEIATPWMPNPADTEYSALGFNDGIEYDVSGYNHNGTKVGVVVASADTPRYSTSSLFDGSSYIINNTSTIHLSNEFTIAWWGKVNSWQKKWEGMFLLQNTPALWSGTEVVRILSCIHGSTQGVMDLAIGQAGGNADFDHYSWPYIIGEWAHYVCTYKAGVVRMYKDGSQTYTATIQDNSSNDYYFTIGRRNSNCNCQMSDFRIYNTALSAADILELYHTPISLSHNGALLTQGEYVES